MLSQLLLQTPAAVRLTHHENTEDIPPSAYCWPPAWWRWENCERRLRTRPGPEIRHFCPRTLQTMKQNTYIYVSLWSDSVTSILRISEDVMMFPEGEKTIFVRVLTFEHILLHFNLVELVGADDDAVAGQMDAAARLQSFNFLWEKIWMWNKFKPGTITYLKKRNGCRNTKIEGNFIKQKNEMHLLVVNIQMDLQYCAKVLSHPSLAHVLFPRVQTFTCFFHFCSFTLWFEA